MYGTFFEYSCSTLNANGIEKIYTESLMMILAVCPQLNERLVNNFF